jgi:septal ring factor EnvC (AmiA/AmiB activator)
MQRWLNEARITDPLPELTIEQFEQSVEQIKQFVEQSEQPTQSIEQRLKTLEDYCYNDYYHLRQHDVDVIQLEDDVVELQKQVKNIVDNLEQFMVDHVRNMFDIQSRIGMLETGIKHIENKDLEDELSIQDL